PLKAFDQDYVNELVKQLEQKGVEFHFNVDTKEIVKDNDQFTIKADNLDLPTDLVIGATGRIPNTDFLDLTKANVKTDKHGVVVNSKLQSSNDKIFAIG